MVVWLQALGLVCGLGAAVFSADAAKRRLDVAIALLAFAGTMAWSGFGRVPSFGMVGLVAAAAAAARIFRPGWPGVSGAVAGFLAAVWISLLDNQGIGPGIAVAMGAGVPAAAAVLARRRSRFAPETLVEDAVLAVGGLALIVAAGPTIADGLGTAGAINLPYNSRAGTLPALFVVMTALAAAAGGGYTLWWRNR